jgi:hypothetical protein
MDNNPKLKDELPLTQKEMQKVLDYGELSPAAYRKKYNETSKRSFFVYEKSRYNM